MVRGEVQRSAALRCAPGACGRRPGRSRVIWFRAAGARVGAAPEAWRLPGATLARGAAEAAAVG